MRTLALISLGFSFLVLQAAVDALISVHPFAPNLLLPMVIYLGVAQDVDLLRGAALSFALGYLLDSFCGSPMGLHTFVLVATYLVARGAGLSLFLRGPMFQIGLTFVVGLLSGGAILALRAIFEHPAPFPVGTASDTALSLLVPSCMTALASPLVFLAVRRIDGAASRREEGAPAL